MGEREVPERMSSEHLRTEERVVEETVTSPCSPLECNGCVPTSRGVAGNGVSPTLHYLCCCLFHKCAVPWVVSLLSALKLHSLLPYLFCTAGQDTALACQQRARSCALLQMCP